MNRARALTFDSQEAATVVPGGHGPCERRTVSPPSILLSPKKARAIVGGAGGLGRKPLSNAVCAQLVPCNAPINHRSARTHYHWTCPLKNVRAASASSCLEQRPGGFVSNPDSEIGLGKENVLDKSIVALLGGASALALVSGGSAAVASPTSEATSLKPAQSFGELIDPIPNAVNVLRAEAQRAGDPGDPVRLAQLYFGYPHHHHHHHHYSYWYWRHRYYHHHHHHNHIVIPLP
jgi:hypothetical protein